MKAEVINFDLSYKNAVVSASLSFTDDENDEGILTFQHPITGASCSNVKDVLQGWKEQSEDEQMEWEKLVSLAADFCDDELYWKIEDGGKYELT